MCVFSTTIIRGESTNTTLCASGSGNLLASACALTAGINVTATSRNAKDDKPEYNGEEKSCRNNNPYNIVEEIFPGGRIRKCAVSHGYFLWVAGSVDISCPGE